jgi:DNA-directed RNA polymerase subunit beta'
VRRVRIGHLELVAPVIHPWYTDALPGWLGLAPETVRQIVDYERWLVIDSNDPDLPAGTLLSDHEWAVIRYDHPEPDVRAALGAEAIESLLQRLPCSTGMAFDGVVMRRLPVLPPELRPMMRLESGRVATSDLNDLYRSVVSRNNRLSRLMDLGSPAPIINNDSRRVRVSPPTPPRTTTPMNLSSSPRPEAHGRCSRYGSGRPTRCRSRYATNCSTCSAGTTSGSRSPCSRC